MRKHWNYTLSLLAIGLPTLVQGDDQRNIFAALDTNKDGFVTADEVPEEKKQLLSRLLRANDKNADGKLSQEEFVAKEAESPKAGLPAMGPGGEKINPAEVISKFDKNGDGKLTKEEAPERMAEHFTRIDANGDGFVEGGEFETAVAMMQRAGGNGAPPTAPSGMPLRGPLLKSLDVDGDSQLSAEEIANASKALLQLDRNGDGKLTADELLPPGMPVGAPASGNPTTATGFNPQEMLQRRVKELDKNGDGLLQRAEAQGPIAMGFDKADTNTDGALDEAKLRAALEALRGKLREGGEKIREKLQEFKKK